jgi:hypothetical protein
MEDEASKRAFEQLKLNLQVTLILWIPYWNKPFLIYYDASREAVGSTLSQLDENGHANIQLILLKKLYYDWTKSYNYFLY